MTFHTVCCRDKLVYYMDNVLKVHIAKVGLATPGSLYLYQNTANTDDGRPWMGDIGADLFMSEYLPSR